MGGSLILIRFDLHTGIWFLSHPLKLHQKNDHGIERRLLHNKASPRQKRIISFGKPCQFRLRLSVTEKVPGSDSASGLLRSGSVWMTSHRHVPGDIGRELKRISTSRNFEKHVGSRRSDKDNVKTYLAFLARTIPAKFSGLA